MTALVPAAARAEAPPPGPLGRRSVTRAVSGRPYPAPNDLNALLAADISKKAFLPFHTLVKARDLAAFEAWHRHDSEDFVYVLSGRIAFHSELYEPVELGPGDSVYFDGRMAHAMVSLGAEDAAILWISAATAASS